MDAEELTSGLRVLCKLLGADVEGSSRECLVDRDVDAAQPGAIHAHVRHEIAAFVRYSDVHRLPDLPRLPLCRRYYLSRICKRDHRFLLRVSFGGRRMRGGHADSASVAVWPVSDAFDGISSVTSGSAHSR